MLRLIWPQVRVQRGRSLAMTFALLVSVAAYTVLSALTVHQRTQLVGLVKQNDRGVYDLLVRPAGSETTLESKDDLVSPEAQTALGGGISLAQWHDMESVPGVYAAAPVAVLGYEVPMLTIPVDLSKYVKTGGPGGSEVLAVKTTQVSENGLTKIPAGPTVYLYITGKPLGTSEGSPASASGVQLCAPPPGGFLPSDPPTYADIYCGSTNTSDQYNPKTEDGSAAQSANSDGTLPTGVVDVTWMFPVLIEAIDPTQEARLTGLNQALVSGRYLGAGAAPADHHVVGASGSIPSGVSADLYAGQEPPASQQSFHWTGLPALVANQSAMQEQLQISVSQLPEPAASAVSSGEDTQQLLGVLSQMKGTAIPAADETLSAQQGYAMLTDGLEKDTDLTPGTQPYVGRQVQEYFSASPTRYTASSAKGSDAYGFSATTQSNGFGGDSNPIWSGELGLGTDGTDFGDLPDTSVRSMTVHAQAEIGASQQVVFDIQGSYDSSMLPAASTSLGSVPMQTYVSQSATAADPATAQALGGKALAPNGNIAGLLTTAPSIITTLSSLPVLEDVGNYQPTGAYNTGIDPSAPISAVRVKLTGQLGTDAASKARLELVAEEIHQRTGLQVDVTMGSSPQPVAVTDPAGKYGRPQILLSDLWTRKGVAALVVAAADEKSLILSWLMLAVCVVFASSATDAAVRTRRRELAILACLGWQARRLFALILTEVCLTGSAAGVGGALVALGAEAVAGLPLNLANALVAVPGAVVLAAGAGLRPAVRAARSHPGGAVSPAVLAPRAGGRRVKSLRSLAFAAIRRTPGRTVVAMLALTAGSGTVVALVGIQGAFHGTVAGSLLGNAAVLQVHVSDYAAAAVTMLLGAAAVADVLYCGIRERAGEFALLQAVGWPDRALNRLVLIEAAVVCWLGAGLGAVAAAVTLAAIAGGVSGALVAWVLATAVVSGVVAMLSASVPLRALGRLVPAALLAE